MPEPLPADSVGIVTSQLITIDRPLALACGEVLASHQLEVECYGELNARGDNALLICHALSGHHHAAGYHQGDSRPGWWDHYIGPGKPIDTNRFYVVCPTNIGSCFGSTGPLSTNPATGRPWAASFPPLRARDWVNSQRLLMDALQINRWAAVVGGSLGGMQAMRWSLEYPELLDHCVVIASAMKLSAQNIAFNEIARRAIKSDPDFCDGDYANSGSSPQQGLALARMIGHVTYLSDELMGQKFGRELRIGDFTTGTAAPVQFEIESYLNHQGDKFSGAFDANAYLLITKMLDYFDLAREYDNDPAKAFALAQCQYQVISFSSDWRFAPQRSREIVNALVAAGRDVCYCEIDSDQGHDAFLLPNRRYQQALGGYLARAASALEARI